MPGFSQLFEAKVFTLWVIHTNAADSFGKQPRDMPPDEACRSGNERGYWFESCHLSNFQLSPNFRLAPKTADGS